MTAEAVLTDLRWDDEVLVPVIPNGSPRPADGPRDHGMGIYTAFAGEPPPAEIKPVATFSLRRLLDELPPDWALTIDPDPSDPAWGSRVIDPRSPGAAVGLDGSVPAARDLLDDGVRRLSGTKSPLRELALLFCAVETEATVYAVRTRAEVGWVVVASQERASVVASRIRQTFGRRPHPPILVVDEADLPPRFLKKLARL